MKIKSPQHLHYPITIVELLRARNDSVTRSAPLFSYYYETVVSEVDRYGEPQDVTKRFPERLVSSHDGVISEWFVRNGTVIHRPGVDLLEIEEPCTHEVQFGGLCAVCGKDMTVVDYLTDKRNSDRATINMTHNNTSLLVSADEAGRADREAKERLLCARKLSLIVDLDQTVIHTTCERTVADWQKDPDNPNYEAVKDVVGFQLADDNVSQVASNWYYVKKRPGLDDFFERMSKIYEMHIYTMATRAYAEEVAKIIDPEGRYFGDRILSRDENYTDKLKSLNRLFPTNTDMVVIIDDRADVWHYCENLVRVPVFNFFPGAGDINASFLPKQQELIAASTKPSPIKAASPAVNPAATVETDTSNGVLTHLGQQLIAMSQDSPEALEQQVKEQEKVIITQQTERPLLQKQIELDKEDEEIEAAEVVQESTETPNGNTDLEVHHNQIKHRHSIFHDDDRGLESIERHLTAVHNAFYAEYRAKKKVAPGGRVAELKGSPKKRCLEFVPDVKEIMPRMKERVLEGTSIVFSGIIPLGMDVQVSDLAMWVKSFGAEVTQELCRDTTHVIANPERKTTKVKAASRYPNIKIVTADWMFQCCAEWEHVDETPYLIEIDPADRGQSPFEEWDDPEVAAGDEGEEAELAQLAMSSEKWKEMDAELAEFMNSDSSDDSDSESVRSEASVQTESKPSQRKRKRKPDATATDESGAEDSDASVTSTNSRLPTRKRRTMENVSSLTNVVTAEKSSSGLPSPETTGPEEEQEGRAEDLDDADSDDDDGLEADFLAAMGESVDDEDAA